MRLAALIFLEGRRNVLDGIQQSRKGTLRSSRSGGRALIDLSKCLSKYTILSSAATNSEVASNFIRATSPLPHLHQDVSCHGGAGILRAAEARDELLSHAHAVVVEQESEDGAVSREELQGADAVQQGFF